MNLNDLSLNELKMIIDQSPELLFTSSNDKHKFYELLYNHTHKIYWNSEIVDSGFVYIHNTSEKLVTYKKINDDDEILEIVKFDSNNPDTFTIASILKNIESRENPISEEDEIIRYLNRTLDHHKRRLASKTRQLSGRKVSEHGGWSLGYHEGSISSLENLLDEINSIKSRK
jgi:hypothetical protein